MFNVWIDQKTVANGALSEEELIEKLQSHFSDSSLQRSSYVKDLREVNMPNLVVKRGVHKLPSGIEPQYLLGIILPLSFTARMSFNKSAVVSCSRAEMGKALTEQRRNLDEQLVNAINYKNWRQPGYSTLGLFVSTKNLPIILPELSKL